MNDVFRDTKGPLPPPFEDSGVPYGSPQSTEPVVYITPDSRAFWIGLGVLTLALGGVMLAVVYAIMQLMK